jgi:hypothetical protein
MLRKPKKLQKKNVSGMNTSIIENKKFNPGEIPNHPNTLNSKNNILLSHSTFLL